MSNAFGGSRKSRESVQNQNGEKKRPSGPRPWLWMVGIAALALALLVPLNLAFAVHDDGLFELGDVLGTPGKADIQGSGTQSGPDWADLFDAATQLKTDVPGKYGGLAAVFIQDELASKGGVDSTTFTGSKNDDPHSTWTYVSGNVPAKDDLSNVYLYATPYDDKNPDTVDDLILYAGLERLDPGGSSHVDIEINQQPISLNADGTFNGEKEQGDILVAMDFENGGALGFVEVYEWMTPANTWQQIVAVNGGSGEGCNPANGYPADTVCAFNNGSPIPNGGWLSYSKNGNSITDLPANAFTE
ncbi:MAG TPA: hypothetical protein VMW34_01885, partial [Anaerolineales bacterium]|nr:hypothetical protein [Anaerolineales bacterium]